jgi:hypothetical protein
VPLEPTGNDDSEYIGSGMSPKQFSSVAVYEMATQNIWQHHFQSLIGGKIGPKQKDMVVEIAITHFTLKRTQRMAFMKMHEVIIKQDKMLKDYGSWYFFNLLFINF